MIKGAIIGFGKIARTNHLEAYYSEEIGNVIKINAVVEVDNEIRENSKSDYKNLNFYASLDEMYSKENIDFIDICTPPKYHTEIIKWAVDKELHVICEKPFTISLTEAKYLYNKLNTSQIFFLPCHQYKYSPVWREFKSYYEQLGRDVQTFMQFNVLRTGADPGLNTQLSPWRLNKEVSGGGILSDTGLHYLYLATWFMGNPIRVTAINNNLAHSDFNVEDTSQVILKFDTGIVQINLTWASNFRKNEAKLISKKGSLYYFGGEFITKNYDNTEELIGVPNISDKSHYTELYINLFSEFATTLHNNYHKEGIEDAFNSIHLLEKCYDSAKLQRSVKLFDES